MATNKIMKQSSMLNKPNNMVKEADDEIRFKAENALRDLTRAEEHKANPELMKHVERMRAGAAEQLDKLKKITVQSNEKKKR